ALPGRARPGGPWRSVAGGPHQLEELVGLADGRSADRDVEAIGVDRLGGGGHLAGGAVVGGQFGVHDDLRVGGQGLLTGVAEQPVVFGRVGGVHLILDDDHVGRSGSRPGNVTADVPVVQVLAGQFRAAG